MNGLDSKKIFDALETFRIELPSWGFANTGTRFGKFIQPAAATTTEEKFSDAGQVHLLTGVCPTVALHVLWDLNGMEFCRVPSTPICFRIRNINTDPSAILMRRFDGVRFSILRRALRSRGG